MRNVILILLIIALYTPNIVQFFSYAKCTVATTNSLEQKICDCLFKKNNITSSIPVEKKEYQLNKENWKYLVPSFLNLFKSSNEPTIQSFTYLLFFPSSLNQEIFHPPIS